MDPSPLARGAESCHKRGRSRSSVPPTGISSEWEVLARLPVTTCPACGTENTPDARFCSACGAPLAVLCAECGAPLPEGCSVLPGLRRLRRRRGRRSCERAEAGHGAVRGRHRLDHVGRAARSRANSGRCSTPTSARCARRSSPRGARSRSSSVTPSWRPSGSRRRTRTIRAARCARRCACSGGSTR